MFWGAFGLVTGAANGLLQQSTREIRIATARSDPVATGPAQPTRCGSPRLVGVIAAVVIAATAHAVVPHVFVESRLLSVILLSVGLAGFCLHATLLGMLAGDNRWSQYGALMVTDAVIRVVIAVDHRRGRLGPGRVPVGHRRRRAVLAAAAAGLADAPGRSHAWSPASDTASFLRGASHAVAAAGASAILVMGFPVLLKATSSDLGASRRCGHPGGHADPRTAAGAADRDAGQPDRPLRRRIAGTGCAAVAGAVAVLAVVGAIGVALAALTGPWLLRVGFGDDYLASGALLAWLTAGAVAIAVLTVTGAATVAAALHRAYSVGWISATVASALLLTLAAGRWRPAPSSRCCAGRW